MKVTFTSNIDRENYVQPLHRNQISINETVVEAPVSKKYVIKGINHRVGTKVISEDLERLGFRTVSVQNMISSRTKKPLPLFEVDLITSSTLPEVLNITAIAFFEVNIEEFRRRRVRKPRNSKIPVPSSCSPSHQGTSQPSQVNNSNIEQTSSKIIAVTTPQQVVTRSKAKRLNQSKSKQKRNSTSKIITSR